MTECNKVTQKKGTCQASTQILFLFSSASLSSLSYSISSVSICLTVAGAVATRERHTCASASLSSLYLYTHSFSPLHTRRLARRPSQLLPFLINLRTPSHTHTLAYKSHTPSLHFPSSQPPSHTMVYIGVITLFSFLNIQTGSCQRT